MERQNRCGVAEQVFPIASSGLEGSWVYLCHEQFLS